MAGIGCGVPIFTQVSESSLTNGERGRGPLQSHYLSRSKYRYMVDFGQAKLTWFDLKHFTPQDNASLPAASVNSSSVSFTLLLLLLLTLARTSLASADQDIDNLHTPFSCKSISGQLCLKPSPMIAANSSSTLNKGTSATPLATALNLPGWPRGADDE